MSNVRPRDLAYTVAPVVIQERGRVVTVLRPAKRVERLEGVTYKGEGVGWVCSGHFADGHTLTVFADYCLRPIRDPGDDAVDETLAGKWAGNKADCPAV